MKVNKEKCSKVSPPPYNRPAIFEFPPLPKWETQYYFAFLIIGAFFIYPKIYTVSRDYNWQSRKALSQLDNLPFFGERRKDITNEEWQMWTEFIWKFIPWLIGHLILFNISEKLLSHTVWSTVMLTYWLIACISLYGNQLVFLALVFGITVYSTMRFTGNKLCIWIVSVAILCGLFFDYFNLVDYINGYATVWFISYKMVQYISFCLEECTNGRQENSSFIKGLYNMFWYAFYFPYLNFLIIIYKKFPSQLEQRRNERNWFSVICFALRILFWWTFVEFMLHFLYFDAICTDAKFMRETTLDVMLLMGYAAGLFFHLKYTIMFGILAVFARIDNMQPPQGPICISRVPWYAIIWRKFDRGLYDFFKEYIYLPICQPTFSLPRKLLGLLISYGFVLIWHGIDHQHVVWIILNIVELFMEVGAKAFYLIPSVRKWRESHISDEWFRRIIALLSTSCWAVGCYGNFYFVTSAEIGYIWVERLFWGETVTLHWPFPFLVFGGYHLVNACIDVERWVVAREKQNKVKIG